MYHHGIIDSRFCGVGKCLEVHVLAHNLQNSAINETLT